MFVHFHVLIGHLYIFFREMPTKMLCPFFLVEVYLTCNVSGILNHHS